MGVAKAPSSMASVVCALMLQAAVGYRPDTDVESGGGGASLLATEPCPTPAPGPAPTQSPTPAPTPPLDCTKDDDDPYVTGDFKECCNGPKSGCLGKHGGNNYHYLCQRQCSVGSGDCEAKSPAAPLKSAQCGDSDEIKILSYNLFWWNLFKGGRKGKPATELIRKNAPFDLMGFQECEDINWVLGDSGQKDIMGSSVGGHAKCIAYNKEKFTLLEEGKVDVGEDRRDQHYGTRGMQWVRLKQTRGDKTVLFANHHGPLPVNTGGKCGMTVTAYNIVNELTKVRKHGDIIILVGDFNADDNSQTQKEIMNWMFRLGSHWVDGIFANCEGGQVKNLGNGGSDHDALQITKKL